MGRQTQCYPTTLDKCHLCGCALGGICMGTPGSKECFEALCERHRTLGVGVKLDKQTVSIIIQKIDHLKVSAQQIKRKIPLKNTGFYEGIIAGYDTLLAVLKDDASDTLSTKNTEPQ